MGNESKPGALAQALRAPLEAGDLTAALEAARRVAMRAPGDDDARRLVEALEMLTSQVWFGGREGKGEGTAGSPFLRAAERLETADLAGALACYRDPAAAAEDPARARRLTHRVEVVLAVLAAQPLPPREPSNAVSAPSEAELRAVDEHQAPTRVGGPTLKPTTPEPIPLESVLVDLEADEVVDEPAHPTLNDATHEVSIEEVEAFDDRSRASRAGLREATRVAKDGELPLDELRRQMAAEDSPAQVDSDLDHLFDDLDLEDDEPASSSPELALDDAAEELEIEVDVELPVTPSRTFKRPSIEELEAIDDVLTPPPYESEPPPPRAPSSPPIPSREALSDDPIHAPLHTGELTLPEHRYAQQGDEPTYTRVDQDATSSWSGVPLFEAQPATFEPGEVGEGEDRWDVPTDVQVGGREREAEALVVRGELDKALKIYEALAARSPEETRLWRRIKAIAWMLKRDVDPTET